MRTTRSKTKKLQEENKLKVNGHISKVQSEPGDQYGKSGVKQRVGEHNSPQATSTMAGRGGGTPKRGGRKEALTLDALADLIKQNGEKMVELHTEFGEFKTTIDTWQEATDTRLAAIEAAQADYDSKVAENHRIVAAADASNASLQTEISEMRKEYKRMLQHIALTQTVVKKVSREANEIGREVKRYNIRFGKIASPVAPPPTGGRPGPKPREDTKQVIVDFIGKHNLHPGKTPRQLSDMIEVAYRTGSVEEERVRHILVKFNRLDDRKTIMVNGKKKERENSLDGSFLQDDLTPDDLSKKRRGHAFMYKMKTEEKRPMFINGRVKTLDGFVKDKDIVKYNTANGVDDTRKKEITVDLLTLNAKTMVGKNKVRIEEETGNEVIIIEEQGATESGEKDKDKDGEADKADSAAGGEALTKDDAKVTEEVKN